MPAFSTRVGHSEEDTEDGALSRESGDHWNVDPSQLPYALQSCQFIRLIHRLTMATTTVMGPAQRWRAACQEW
ncbi:uncharacterized, partial [Tachysurus ichikawai]